MDFVTKLFAEVRRIVRECIAQNAPTLVYGEVLGIEPVRVRIKDTYEVDEDFLVLDSRCREMWIRIPTDGEYEHIHDEDEMLIDVQGTTAAGPVIFAPAGELPSPTIEDPPGSGQYVPNPDFPTSPSTLTLRHKHGIHKSLEKICLWRGLKAGDKVKILRIGAVHIVLERLEGITNDTDGES